MKKQYLIPFMETKSHKIAKKGKKVIKINGEIPPCEYKLSVDNQVIIKDFCTKLSLFYLE